MTQTPTPAPEVAQAAATLDPTTLALLSILGILLTVGAGFVGAWIQSRREHEKWLRGQRYEAYVTLLRLTAKIVSMRHQATDIGNEVSKAESGAEVWPEDLARLKASSLDLMARSEDAYERLRDVSAPMRILGPASVESDLNQLVPRLTDPDQTKADAAEDAIVAAMRKALGIKD